MPEYVTPGVYFEYRDTAPTVRGIRTDIAGFVGLAQRGPLDVPTRVESWRQFQAIFGSFVSYGFLAYGVKGFFENGGRACYVVRDAAPTAAKGSFTMKNAAGTDIIRLDAANEGTWSGAISITLLDTNASAGTFALRVNCGPALETFRDLSADPAAERYFATVINSGTETTAASRWVTAEALSALPDDMMPNAAESGMTDRVAWLTGGADGLAALSVADLLGDPSVPPAEMRGLCALGLVDEVSIIAIPDIQIRPVLTPSAPPPPKLPPMDPCLVPPVPAKPAAPGTSATEQPPGFTESEIARLQEAMVLQCENLKDRFAVLDAPLDPTTFKSLTVTNVAAKRNDFESERGFAALYYPWIKVYDPIGTPGALMRTIPPSGHVCGLYARTDLDVGVHKAPANGALEWCADVAVNVGDEEHGVLNPIGVNCIRPFPGRGIRVFGARTISSNADWRYVNVRRLMMMIEEAVDESTQWAVFEPHNALLRQGLIAGVSSYLNALWKKGCLAGKTAAEAYFVRCDDSNNPQTSVDAGRIIVDVGVAAAIPAEFIVFRIGRTAEELEIVER